MKSPINLLVATGLYPPDIGGPATYARMLEDDLPAHGFKITIVTFTAVRHLPKVLRHIAFFWNVLRASKGQDIIYALDPISVGIPARLVSYLTGIPFIIRLGGDYAWEQGQQRFALQENLDKYTADPSVASWQVRLLAFLQSKVVRSARFCVLPSEYLKSIVVTWGVVPTKIRVMYSSLFPLYVKETKAELREQLGHSGKVITSVGRLVPWKGFVGLIEAVALLKEEQPDLSVRIIGDGPFHETLKAKAIELGVADRVVLVGKLDKVALGREIKASDLFVLNTEYEGLSHQLLEVMDLGVPIVTTRVGGNPELITNDISGALVEVGDTVNLAKSIQHILVNESTQTRLSQNALLRTKDFTKEAVIEKIATFLKTEVLQ